MQIDLLEGHILAPRSAVPQIFTYVLENGQVLLVHSPLRTGVPLTIFLKRSQKLA